MRLQPLRIKRLWSLFQMISLAMFGLWLSLLALINFTATPLKTPISPAPVLAGPPISSSSFPLKPNELSSANPVASAFINAVPGLDGQEILVSVAGVNSTGSPIFLNIDPGSGPAGHKGGYAMTLSGTTYVATAIGFAPGVDVGNDGDDTMSITTTLGSQVMSTGPINFNRAFVQTSDTKQVPVDNFTVQILNTDTFTIDTYLLAMSTNVPPGPLPPGYNFASSTYNMRPSGSLTQSERLMTLKLAFQEPLPNNADIHTLAVVGWNQLNQTWNVLGGDLFTEADKRLVLTTKSFRIYALATTPIWRDSFKEFSLTGVSARTNTTWGPGDTIILATGATSGAITSIPITPTNAANWGTLHFSATTSLSTGLTVDALDVNNTVLMTNVNDGADLSTIPISVSLKLRATLTSTVMGETPELHEWSVSWVPKESRVYLPLVIKGDL